MGFIFFIFAYYIVWLTTLYLVSLHYAYYPLLVSIFISACQCIYLLRALDKRAFFFIIGFTYIGFGIDSILMQCNIFIFHINPWSQYTAPPWILGLWLNFSVLCLGIIPLLGRLRPYLSLIALIGFPLAYYAGAQFDAVTFQHHYWILLILGGIWMLVLPITLKLFIFDNSIEK